MKEILFIVRSVISAKVSSLLVCIVFSAFLFNNADGQVISEGFEGAEWITSAGFGPAKTINAGGNTQSSWVYSTGFVQSTFVNSVNNPSSTKAFAFASSGSGFLITPVITNGVSTITFYSRSSSNNSVSEVGFATNSTFMTGTITNWRTATITSATSNPWIATSTFSNTISSRYFSWSVDASFLGTNSTKPLYVRWRRISGDLYLDDIVITSPEPLPVSFTNVKAYKKEAGIQVEWNISAEQNVWNYEVERSANGTSFDKVGDVFANNNKTYNWFDASPNNGINYYRVKVVDKDNAISYSHIVQVKSGSFKGDIAVYPNPVKGGAINVQLVNLERGNYSVRLVNDVGQILVTNIINHEGGSINQSIALPAAIKTGIYYLQVLGNGKTYKQRLLVQ